jgi:hypothetical protein
MLIPCLHHAATSEQLLAVYITVQPVPKNVEMYCTFTLSCSFKAAVALEQANTL